MWRYRLQLRTRDKFTREADGMAEKAQAELDRAQV